MKLKTMYIGRYYTNGGDPVVDENPDYMRFLELDQKSIRIRKIIHNDNFAHVYYDNIIEPTNPSASQTNRFADLDMGGDV
jgi:hypothetical protein